MYLFFPYWHWKIPKELYEKYECVGFHMTDLPFGRGGSPLQNLIVRDIKETKITAFKITEEMDTGPIYLKKDLSLEGTANEILSRAYNIIYNEMIPYIIKNKPVPVPQTGKPTIFKRRKPEDGNISNLGELEKIYDYIRMLDDINYPPAFIETKHIIFNFSKATLHNNCVKAEVIIKNKEEII